MPNPLQQLHQFGQSPWYDNISRDVLDSGQLQRLVDLGIRGLTSNPSIFNKAITSGSAYDAQLRSLIDGSRTPQEIYEALAVEDIRRACDILRPIHEASDGVDGFVSLEVSPLLASDTASTIQEARRLRALVDRPNLLIKIPATPEGIPAIEESLAEGLSINVTLIFSRKVYAQVMEAYLRALERRVEAGQDIRGVASVASFFVSRVDTLVDSLLAARLSTAPPAEADRLRGLMGRAAIANARLAYQDFKRMFSSDRFRRLEAHGGRVQRPLWASTSTKNPAYRDVLYVDTLIGPHTVNTMPGETVEAFLDHGTVALTVEQGLDEAQALLQALAALDIHMDSVTQRLLEDGVAKFAEPFEALLAAIESKTRQFAAAD